MLTYALENFSALSVEIKPLLQKHWHEIAVDRDTIALDVDYERYRHIDACGSLVLITGRQDAQLVGYIAAFISTHLHYASTLHAIIDVFYLKPAYRQAQNGLGLFVALEVELQRRGVRKVVGQTKLGERDVSKVFEFLGWTETERLFTKVL